jgi:hypothetical protein
MASFTCMYNINNLYRVKPKVAYDYVGVLICFWVFLLHYFYTHNTFITSKFIVLYMSDLKFTTVAWLFTVCSRSEVKTRQNNGDVTATERRAVMKYLFFHKGELVVSIQDISSPVVRWETSYLFRDISWSFSDCADIYTERPIHFIHFQSISSLITL